MLCATGRGTSRPPMAPRPLRDKPQPSRLGEAPRAPGGEAGGLSLPSGPGGGAAQTPRLKGVFHQSSEKGRLFSCIVHAVETAPLVALSVFPAWPLVCCISLSLHRTFCGRRQARFASGKTMTFVPQMLPVARSPSSTLKLRLSPHLGMSLRPVCSSGPPSPGLPGRASQLRLPTPGRALIHTADLRIQENLGVKLRSRVPSVNCPF